MGRKRQQHEPWHPTCTCEGKRRRSKSACRCQAKQAPRPATTVVVGGTITKNYTPDRRSQRLASDERPSYRQVLGSKQVRKPTEARLTLTGEVDEQGRVAITGEAAEVGGWKVTDDAARKSGKHASKASAGKRKFKRDKGGRLNVTLNGRARTTRPVARQANAAELQLVADSKLNPSDGTCKARNSDGTGNFARTCRAVDTGPSQSTTPGQSSTVEDTFRTIGAMVVMSARPSPTT